MSKDKVESAINNHGKRTVYLDKDDDIFLNFEDDKAMDNDIYKIKDILVTAWCNFEDFPDEAEQNLQDALKEVILYGRKKK